MGQIANDVALLLREAGKGTMYCTAGIGGHATGLVEGARQAKIIIGIDGCAVQCAKKCLEAEKLEPSLYFVVTEGLEIKKAYERPVPENVEKVAKHIEQCLNDFEP